MFWTVLAISPQAHAEAALGGLVFMLPKLPFMGVYCEVTHPTTRAVI